MNIPEIFIDLGQNIAIALALIFIFSLLRPTLKKFPARIYTLAMGLLFGLIALIAMLIPIQITSGVIIDGRVVIVALAGLFGGWEVALIAAGMTGAYRLYLGGVGTIPGLGAIFAGAAIGIGSHWRWSSQIRYWRGWHFLLFGIALAIQGLLWTFLLPKEIAWPAFKLFALPVLIFYPLGAFFLGMLFSYQLRRFESEERFQNLVVGSIEGILVHRDTKPLFVNPAYAHLLGYDTPADILAMESMLPLIAPYEQERLINYKKARVSGKYAPTHYEYDAVCKDGAIVTVQQLVTTIMWQGKPAILATVIDMTERKKTEEALLQSQDFLRSIYEDSETAIFVIKVNGIGDYVYEGINPVYETLFSMTNKDIVGKSPRALEDTYGKDAIDYLYTIYDECVNSKRVHLSEYEVPMIDGTKAWWFSTLKPLVNKNGTVYRLIGSSFNITDRKQAEGALIESNQRFVQFADNIEDVFWLLEVEAHNNYKVLYVNSAFEGVWQRTPEEIYHDPSVWYNCIHDEDKEQVAMAFTNFLQGNEKFNLEFRIIRPDKTMRTIATKGNVIRDEHGNIIRATGIATDISERKHVEAELAFQASLLEQVHNGIITLDLNNKITYWNKFAEELYQWKSEEALGKDIVGLLSPKEMKNTVINNIRIIDREGHWEGEFNVKRKDGNVISALIINTLLKDVHGKKIGILGISIDISERKRAEKAQLKLEKLESLGVLAGGIAHDFNNLLTGLYGNLKLTKMFLPADHKVQKYLNVAENSMENAIRLTDQLLTFAKGGDPIKETVALGDVILETAVFSLRGSNVKLKSNIASDLWLVEADKGQLSQVISNLVINAQQAMPTGGVVVITAVNINSKDGKQVQITVEDKGTGIAPQYLDKIFDPYFSTKQKGSGLGLASSYSIINKHNGRIQVSSQLNLGTTFIIQLPATEETITEQPLDKANDKHATVATILLLDDEEVIRETVGGMLEAMGHQFEFAIDGQEAITKYEAAYESNGGYDLVITDLTIPGGMGGQEAAQKILKINPQAKLIVSSGYATDPVMANYKGYGFSSIVVKPYRFAELQWAIQQALFGH